MRRSCSGPRAASATPRDFLGDSFLVISGDALTDIDLTAMREFHESHDGIATLATKRVARHEPVRRRDHRRRRPHPGLPGEAGPRRGALRPRQLRHLHVPRRDLRLLPGAGDEQGGRRGGPGRLRRLGDGRLSRPCSRPTFPSTRTRSTPTGTTSATSRSCGRATSTRWAARSTSIPALRRWPRACARRAPSTEPRSGAGADRRGGRARRGREDRGPGDRRRRLPDRRGGLHPGLDPARRRRGARRAGSWSAASRRACARFDGRLTFGAPRAHELPTTIGRWMPCRPSSRTWCRRSARPVGGAVATGRSSALAAPGAWLPSRRSPESGPSGVDRAWSSAPHEGVARDLVVALKFRRLLPVADLMAERIEWLAPAELLGGTIVPVPTSPLRSLVRGFDPAARDRRRAGGADRAAAAPSAVAKRRAAARWAGGAASGSATRRRIRSAEQVPPQRHPRRRRADHRGDHGRLRQGSARARGAVRVAAVTFSRRL